jgi:hypothetical protein
MTTGDAFAGHEGSTLWPVGGGAGRAAETGPATPAVIDGWRIEAHLGSSRWSDVFLAKGELDGTPRRLALKLVRVDAPSQSGEAVVREAHALSEFRHRHLIHAFAAWQTPADGELGGAVVFLLPLAELSLADHLRDRAAIPGEPAGAPGICAAAAGLADALAYLHGSRKADGSGPVVHNDVKPENILQIGGRWLLSDLGFASPPGRDGLAAHAGSLSYLAPEYLTSPPAGKHPPGDIWAFGVVLHRWLSGGFPFGGNTPGERAQAVRDGAQAELTVTHPELRALISAMIARRPDDRPAAGEVARRLRAVAGLPRRRPKIRPAAAAAAAALVVLGGAGGALAYSQLGPQPQVRTVLRFASYGTARSLVAGHTVPVLAGPRLTDRVVGRLNDGAPAAIICTARGDVVHGNWGPTRVWDRISYRHSAGWVSDGLLYTGTNAAVAPGCKGA